MKTITVIILCFALSVCVQVYAEGELEVKRGLYPFMAFIYYPDETVVDRSGARFLRGAVLIKENWLVTSALGSSIGTTGPLGFPRKTLLARLGAVAIDANFTLNEDEDEQEREVTHIVRPYNYSATQWWHTDISLMKTLLPFNLTAAIALSSLSSKVEYVEKTCLVLVFSKMDGNQTGSRKLIQLVVELLPPSIVNCGHHYVDKTMTCAADSDENKNAVYDPNFCRGNSGGPLICEGNVIGLQTYIDNDCKQPHLYQLLSAWEDFISCGTEDKCHEEQCSMICDVVEKDPSSDIEVSFRATEAKTRDTYDTTIKASVEALTRTLQAKEEDMGEDIPSTEATAATTADQSTVQSSPTESFIREYSESITHVSEENTVNKTWPPEKKSDSRRLMEQSTEEVKTTIEAQQEKVESKKKRGKKSAATRIPILHSFFFGCFIFTCLI